jgi:hypothetical protein
MNNKKKRMLISLLLIALIITYCWVIILATPILATLRHYIGLFIFVCIILLFFKNLASTTILTGIFLLLATFNLLAITPSIDTFQIGLNKSISTPPIQPLSVGLLILYFWINGDSLIDIYLDYKEGKLKES